MCEYESVCVSTASNTTHAAGASAGNLDAINDELATAQTTQQSGLLQQQQQHSQEQQLRSDARKLISICKASLHAPN